MSNTSEPVCVGRICGTEYPKEQGEKEWHTKLEAICKRVAMQKGTRCDPASPGLDLRRLAPGIEAVFYASPSSDFLQGVLRIQTVHSVLFFSSFATLSDATDVDHLHESFRRLAAAWREGEAGCVPQQAVLRSGAFVKAPSVGDHFEIPMHAQDATRGIGVSLVIVEEKDPEAHIRRYLRRDRIAHLFFVRMLGGRPLVKDPKLRKQIRKEPRRLVRRVYRSRKRKVAGLRGDELILAPQEDPGETPRLVLAWAYPGRSHDPHAPSSSISMSVPYDPKTVKQTLAVWDAMLTSFEPFRKTMDATCIRLPRASLR